MRWVKWKVEPHGCKISVNEDFMRKLRATDSRSWPKLWACVKTSRNIWARVEIFLHWSTQDSHMFIEHCSGVWGQMYACQLIICHINSTKSIIEDAPHPAGKSLKWKILRLCYHLLEQISHAMSATVSLSKSIVASLSFWNTADLGNSLIFVFLFVFVFL